MEMQDKLRSKRIRVDWFSVIKATNEVDDFKAWKKTKFRKVKSRNKLCYLYILNVHGRDVVAFWRNFISNKPVNVDYLEYLRRIATVPWINLPVDGE